MRAPVRPVHVKLRHNDRLAPVQPHVSDLVRGSAADHARPEPYDRAFAKPVCTPHEAMVDDVRSYAEVLDLQVTRALWLRLARWTGGRRRQGLRGGGDFGEISRRLVLSVDGVRAGRGGDRIQRRERRRFDGGRLTLEESPNGECSDAGSAQAKRDPLGPRSNPAGPDA